MEQTRDQSWKLVSQYIQSVSLRRHCLAVEAAMRHYARHFNEDEELWGITGILGHANFTNTPRQTLMAKCLYAVDELAGFVVACAYVNPRRLAGLEARSVIKKLKRKDFAANVGRHEIEQGIAELGVGRDNHIQMIIDALRFREQELGFTE